MKARVILGHQLAVEAGRFLETVVKCISENKKQLESATYVPRMNTPLSTVPD